MRFDAFTKRLGENVRRARWAARMTQEELAAKTMTYRLLGELERGRANPTLITLHALARALKVRISDLVDVEPTDAAYVPIGEREAVEPKRGRRARR